MAFIFGLWRLCTLQFLWKNLQNMTFKFIALSTKYLSWQLFFKSLYEFLVWLEFGLSNSFKLKMHLRCQMINYDMSESIFKLDNLCILARWSNFSKFQCLYHIAQFRTTTWKCLIKINLLRIFRNNLMSITHMQIYQ